MVFTTKSPDPALNPITTDSGGLDRTKLPVSSPGGRVTAPPSVTSLFTTNSLIDTKIRLDLNQVTQQLSKEYNLSLPAVTLFTEFALHQVERTLVGQNNLRLNVRQRLTGIRQRVADRGLSQDALNEVETLVSGQIIAMTAASQLPPEGRLAFLENKIIRPALDILKRSAPSLSLTAEEALKDTFTRLDPLSYRIKKKGPSLESQFGVSRSGRGSRSSAPLASRGGYTRGTTRRFTGEIDCSGYTCQAIRGIAVGIMLTQGVNIVDAVMRAQQNVPDISTADMRRQAKKDNIGGLSKSASADELRAAFREGRIKLGDALVVPPPRGKPYGHTGMLAINKKGELVVQESASGHGVIENSLERWADLGQKRGSLQIFRHPYLVKLGLFNN